MSFYLEGIWAGICIAIGSLVYLSQPNIIGATLFSIGLITILLFRFKLYTGMIGFINKRNFKDCILALILNAIGCCIVLTLPFNDTAASIVSLKLADPLYKTFIEAILCGILIAIAVLSYKKEKVWVVSLAVITFITMGAEHSIADICFILSARAFSIEALIFIGIVIIGNAIGAITLCKSLEIKK